MVVGVINLKKMGISATEYQKRLQPFLKLQALQEITSQEILKEEESIKGLKEQDFLEGDIYGDGKTLVSYRSKNYELFKAKKNPIAGGAVDLILTGSFVNAMKLNKPKDGRYMFGNTDKKRNILKEMYGENIFGLNQNVFAKFQKDIILPRFIRSLKKKANIS